MGLGEPSIPLLGCALVADVFHRWHGVAANEPVVRGDVEYRPQQGTCGFLRLGCPAVPVQGGEVPLYVGGAYRFHISLPEGCPNWPETGCLCRAGAVAPMGVLTQVVVGDVVHGYAVAPSALGFPLAGGQGGGSVLACILEDVKHLRAFLAVGIPPSREVARTSRPCFSIYALGTLHPLALFTRWLPSFGTTAAPHDVRVRGCQVLEVTWQRNGLPA